MSFSKAYYVHQKAMGQLPEQKRLALEKMKSMGKKYKVLSIHIPSGNYYTLEQLAQLYNVTRRTAQQWIEKGWLKSILIGGAHLIEAGQLENFTRPKPGRQKVNL